MHLLQGAAAWLESGGEARGIGHGVQAQSCEQHLHQEPLPGVPRHCCGAAPAMGHALSNSVPPWHGAGTQPWAAPSHGAVTGHAQATGTYPAVRHPPSTHPAMEHPPAHGHALALRAHTQPMGHITAHVAQGKCWEWAVPAATCSRKDLLWGRDEAKPQKRGSP